jgi:hypothetical protein
MIFHFQFSIRNKEAVKGGKIAQIAAEGESI